MRIRWGFLMVILAIVLATAGHSVAQTAPTQPDPAVQAKKLVQRTRDTTHQFVDTVLAYPSVSEADKAQLRALLQEFDKGLQKLLDDAQSQQNWMISYGKVQNLAQPPCEYIQHRLDLYWVVLCGGQIANSEIAMMQRPVAWQGKSDMYQEVLDAAAIDTARQAQVRAIVDKLRTDLTAPTKITKDSSASAAERQSAMDKCQELATSARKEVRSILTAEQNQDLDWAILHKIPFGKNFADFIVFSTFTAPVNAPVDGKYSLKSGDKKMISNTIATVTLKKGQPMGFRTVDKALKGYAGEKEFSLPDPLPFAVLWQFDGDAERAKASERP